MYKKRKMYDKEDTELLYVVEYGRNHELMRYFTSDKDAFSFADMAGRNSKVYMVEEVTTMRSWRLTKK